MGILKNNINTIPGESYFRNGEVDPNSVPFVVCACEGEEECLYLSIFQNKHPQLIKVNDFYNDEKAKKSQSHPQKRFEALSEFLDGDLDIKGFSEKLDKAFLIVDRDNQSFKENQYDEIVSKCAEKNIEFIISNPSFQLWLLLHFFSDINSLNLDKECKSKKQIEIVQNKIREYITYKHGSLNTGYFSPKIQDALKNSEQFCLEVNELKNKIGTRFPILVNYLLKEDN